MSRIANLKNVRLLFAAMPVAIVLLAACAGDRTVTGTISHKSVTVERDGKSMTLLTNRVGDDGPVIVVDPEMTRYMSSGTGVASIHDSLALQIEADFDRVRYWVNISENEGKPGTVAVEIDMDLFSDLVPGESVQLAVSRSGDFLLASASKW